MIPILTYHSLDDSGSVVSTPPGVFAWQMRLLAERGYRGIAVSDLVHWWERGDPTVGIGDDGGSRNADGGLGESTVTAIAALDDSRPIVLTFDDGYENVLEHAASVLAELRFRATTFVIPDRCGGDNQWPGQPPSMPRLPLLSWSQLRECRSAGIEAGCHGMTHASLPGLSTADLQREVVEAKRTIEDRMGEPAEAFAYPYGHENADVRSLVAENYRAACGAELGWATTRADRWRLQRIEMYYLRSPAFFRMFPGPVGRAYLGLRGLLRRGRGRSAA